MGESGSGKTTSMRNLDPKTTLYIDADKKGLSWKGWRNDYNKDNKNYYQTSDAGKILAVFKMAQENTGIKTVVIDTLNGIMIDDEMKRAKEKGYDKWMDLASCVYGLVATSLAMREDLFVIFTAHTQTERDESGYTFTRIKTNGKKLDKIVLESKFPTVLYAKAVDGKNLFEVHAKNSTAKTPMGAFEENEIENDIVKVLEVLKEF
jgi:hypothetical protein